MAGNPEQKLKAALVLSRGLLESALAGEWEEARNLEAGRAELLREGLGVLSPQGAENQISLIKEIQEIDRQIMQLANQERPRLAEQLAKFKKGRVANRAYRQG